jgi:hypothetical protein
MKYDTKRIELRYSIWNCCSSSPLLLSVLRSTWAKVLLPITVGVAYALLLEVASPKSELLLKRQYRARCCVTTRCLRLGESHVGCRTPGVGYCQSKRDCMMQAIMVVGQEGDVARLKYD